MAMWIGFGIMLLAFVIVVALFANKLNTLFSAKHLSEISDGIAGLKIAALKAILRPGQIHEQELYSSQVDEQTFVTSTGFGLMYTISKQGDLYCHHISVSQRTGVLAHSAAMTIATWLAYFLEIPAEKVTVPPELSGAPGEVWHITFELSEAEEERYEQTRPRILATTDVTPLLWQQMGTPRDIIVQHSLANSKLQLGP
jgi:hypothetical protein